MIKRMIPVVLFFCFSNHFIVEICGCLGSGVIKPEIIHHISVSGCRAVTLWQPHIIRPFNWIINNNNHVNVIRHHHKFRDRHIIIDFRDFFDAT